MTYVRRWRWYQSAFFQHLISVQDCRAIEIAHRRWGKDEVALGAANQRMHQRVGTYWHCLPEYAQARKAIWEAVNAHTGKRRIDEAFPPETRRRTLNDEMFIELANGSTWQCIGSDRYNATVGAGPVFITYSEWALANPGAWAYHRPMLEENGGGAAFITTPRGKNHAHAMHQRYRKMMAENPRYFAEISTIHDTGALSPAQLEESLAEYVDLYGEDLGQAQFEQEYECSFTAAILGAFYARELAKVRNEGRVTEEAAAVPGIPVHRAWDLGVRDDTSIWWFQVVGGQLYILDCYSKPGESDIEVFAEMIHAKNEAKGWMSGKDLVPPDARQRVWGMKRGRLETMRECGLDPEVVPDLSKLDGINAVRRTLPKCVFHPDCEESGLPALENYRREWDDDRKIFKANEVHDWASHGADAFRYLSVGWRVIPEKKVERPKPLFPLPGGGVIAPPLPSVRR